MLKIKCCNPGTEAGVGSPASRASCSGAVQRDEEGSPAQSTSVWPQGGHCVCPGGVSTCSSEVVSLGV